MKDKKGGPLYLLEGTESQEQTRLPPLLPCQSFYDIANIIQRACQKGGGSVGLGLKGECEKDPGSLGT